MAELLLFVRDIKGSYRLTLHCFYLRYFSISCTVLKTVILITINLINLHSNTLC